jgi:hypothetical protein
MATDFAAFKKEFDAQGIQAEYRSVCDIDEVFEKEGSLIYGRDDIPGRPREIVLEKGHEKFYSIQSQPRKMKRDILSWVRTVVPAAERNDSIILVLISHGTGKGTVVIRGEQPEEEVDYLTTLEVKTALTNLTRNTFFTLINTCCYAGYWVNLAQTGLGNHFVHAATKKREEADNFVTSSGKFRDGVFVTALLECLKKNGDGTLSEFVAEILKAEVTGYQSPISPQLVPPTPTSAVSHHSFWKRQLNAFIPIHTDSTLAETVTATIADIANVKLVKLADLFKLTRPAKLQKTIPDEVVAEVWDAQQAAARRGGANGEDQMYHACQGLLEGAASQSDQDAVFKTVEWRERGLLRAARIARHLDEIGIIDSSNSMDVDSDEVLSLKGALYYHRAFSGSRLIERSKLPPKGCVGGPYEAPYMWLSKLVGSSGDNVSVTRLKEKFEQCLAAAIIAESK